MCPSRREPARPWCTETSTKGQPCACFSSDDLFAKFICGLDWQRTGAEHDLCVVTIDDAGKRISTHRR
jgi:hypothetical protein